MLYCKSRLRPVSQSLNFSLKLTLSYYSFNDSKSLSRQVWMSRDLFTASYINSTSTELSHVRDDLLYLGVVTTCWPVQLFPSKWINRVILQMYQHKTFAILWTYGAKVQTQTSQCAHWQSPTFNDWRCQLSQENVLGRSISSLSHVLHAF